MTRQPRTPSRVPSSSPRARIESVETRPKPFESSNSIVNINALLEDLLENSSGPDTLREALGFLDHSEEQLINDWELQRDAYIEVQEWRKWLLRAILFEAEEYRDEKSALQNLGLAPRVKSMSQGLIEQHISKAPDNNYYYKASEDAHRPNCRNSTTMVMTAHNRSALKATQSHNKASPGKDIPKLTEEDIPAEAWIMKDWLKTPYDGQSDTQAEHLFSEGKLQQCLTHIDRLLTSLLPAELTINLLLLASCALRASDFPHQGLVYTERALRLASKESLPAMARKGQLYRGMCLYEMGFYYDATWCFELAGGLLKHAAWLREMESRAQMKRKDLAPDDPRRKTSSGFKAIPLN